MKIGSMLSRFGRMRALAVQVCLVASIAAWSAPVFAQTPSNVGTGIGSLPSGPAAQRLASNPKYQQWLYFYQQRAYPYDRIPQGALQAARQDFIAKWGIAPGANQPKPASPLAANPPWSSIGPTPISNGQTNPQSVPVSGRVNAIAIDPTNANVIYIGAADGGVWKTIDGGTTWTPLTNGQCSMAMGALAIDPTNTNIVYAGTGEENFSADSYYGCGVLRSTDGGQTWTQLGASTFARATISRILVDPSSPETLIVAAGAGGVDFSFAQGGVYRSTDSGATWTEVLVPGTNFVATDVVRDPLTPGTLYAAIGNIGGSASNGVYKSLDGGQTWTQLAGGLPTSDVGRINLAIAPSSVFTVYAAVQSVSSNGLLGIWKSTNAGTNWTKLSATNATCTFGNPPSSQCWYDMYLWVDPRDANIVYFGTQDVFRSVDGGNTFVDLGGYNSGNIHPDQHAFAFAPNDSNTIVIGNDGGVFKSTDNGGLWSSLNQNLTLTQFNPGLATTPNGLKVLAGAQDNGIDTYTGSIAWTQLDGGDGGYSAIDFTTPTTYYSEHFGVSPQKSTDSGQTWTSIKTGIVANANLFYPPFVMSPTNPQRLYYGTDNLNITTNGGNSWTPISPAASGDVISTIVEAKSNSQVIYYGTSNGDVKVSTDGGFNFNSKTTGLPNRFVTRIVVNPTDPTIAFVTVSGFGSGHVWETVNGGTSWSNISGNLPDLPVNTILLDPAAPTTDFFIGTDLGVFRSRDGGQTWTPYQNGLPNVVVEDLVYNSATGTLFASTHGQGVWTTVIGTPIASHDFNGNGKSDILWRNGNAVAMWLMNGGTIATNGLVVNNPVLSTWSIVGQRDFNGDGKADILWRDTNGYIAVWLMNGGTISSSVLVAPGAVPSNWSIVGTGDFNGDGNGDILWQDDNGNVAIWLLDNTGHVASNLFLGNVPSNWTIIRSSGNVIVWRDTAGNTAVWLTDKTGHVSSNVFLGNVPSNWYINGVGDFNGDGNLDILWRDINGDVAIWLLDSSGHVTSNLFVSAVSNVWQVAETGDFNGDGKSDILWQDSAGDTAIWFMNSGTVVSSVFLARVDTAWAIQRANAE